MDEDRNAIITSILSNATETDLAETFRKQLGVAVLYGDYSHDRLRHMIIEEFERLSLAELIQFKLELL